MSKKRIILIVIIVFLVIIFSFLFYRFFIWHDDSVNKKYVDLENDNNKVSITAPLSLNDETGRKIDSNKDGVNVYYKIQLKSKVNKISRYKILLSVKHSDKNVEDAYVKILLATKEDKLIKFYDRDSYATLDKLPMFKNKYLLHEGRISGHSEKEFILRLWMSDFYVMDKENQKFEGRINIYSY